MTLTPLQSIEFGRDIPQAQREAILFEHQNSPVLNVVLLYLRDEWYAAVDEAVNQKRAGNSALSDMALGSVDAYSQAIVKLKSWSETAPEVK